MKEEKTIRSRKEIQKFNQSFLACPELRPFLNYMVLSGVRGGWQGLTALISDGEMSGNLELRVVTLLQRVVGMRCCIGKSIRYVGHEQRKISMFCQSRHALRLCNSIR